MIKESKMIKYAQMLESGQMEMLQLEEWDSQSLMEVTMYLDSHHQFYKITEEEDEEVVVVTMVQDAEEKDCFYEDLNCLELFSELSREEEKLISLIAKLREEHKHNYYCYMTKTQMLNIRFALIKYMTEANLDAYYTQGLVVIH